jgi:hypothetical protein
MHWFEVVSDTLAQLGSLPRFTQVSDTGALGCASVAK